MSQPFVVCNDIIALTFDYDPRKEGFFFRGAEPELGEGSYLPEGPLGSSPEIEWRMVWPDRSTLTLRFTCGEDELTVWLDHPEPCHSIVTPTSPSSQFDVKPGEQHDVCNFLASAASSGPKVIILPKPNPPPGQPKV